ncbi:hypothetical protein C8Q73DRAFT_507189 [Cubamyces lactineus]|nr:hypothetical protein C8Q73DRAFT_507189 [Cubamyces lactineus]
MQGTDGPIITTGPPLHPPSNVPITFPSNAPPSRRKLVPKPLRGLKRMYSGSIRPDDLPKFIEAKLRIKRLVGAILNINVCWGSQEKHDIGRLQEEILKDFPIFAEYEGAWPVMYYAYQQLGDYRRTIDPSLKRYSKPRRLSVRLPAQASSKGCGGRQNGPAMRAPGCARGNVNARTSGEDIARAGKTNANQRDAACPRAHPDSTTTSQVPLANFGHQTHNKRLVGTVDLTGRDDKDVFEFLCGIDSTFAYLLDRFRMAGLTSKMRLTTFAKWSATDVDEFLTSEMRLTPFERKAVKVALGKLVG